MGIRHWFKWGGAALLCLTTGAASANPLVTIDEWGNGNQDGVAIQSAFGIDPLSGIRTLDYAFGKGVSGDVIMIEPHVTGALQISDVIRFIGGHIYFFSDPSEPGAVGPPADVNAADFAFITNPANFQVNVVRIFEVGPEENNGSFYTPGQGDPGFFPGGPTYHFISDSPEPTTLAGAVVGAVVIGLGLVRRRRKLSG